MENAQWVLSCLLHLLMDTAPHQRWDFVCGDLVILEYRTLQYCRSKVSTIANQGTAVGHINNIRFRFSVCCFTPPDSHLWLRWLKTRTLHPGFKVGSSSTFRNTTSVGLAEFVTSRYSQNRTMLSWK